MMATAEQMTTGGQQTDMTAKKTFGWKHGLFFPIFLAFLFTCGLNGATQARLPIEQPAFYLQFVLFSLFFSVLFAFVFRFAIIPAQAGAEGVVSAERPSRQRIHLPRRCAFLRFRHECSARGIAGDALRLFCGWLPYLILLYPGVVYWDTGDQVAQFFGIPAFGYPSGYIWDHHPFFDTYIYGSIIWLGHKMTGSYTFGIFLHSFLQLVFAAVVIALWLAYLKKRGIRKGILTGITLFFLVFPLFPIMFISMAKDVTNALFFALWVLLFVRLVDSRGAVITSVGFDISFVVVSFAASMSKKLGMYIILISLVFLLFAHLRKAVKVAAVGLIAILVCVESVLLPKFYYPAAHIVKGEAIAGIVMPIQLLGRAAHDHPDDVTQEERDSVSSLLIYDWDQISKQYNPYISDPVTGFSNKSGSRKAFLKTWVRVGLRHPLSYINGFFSLESGWITFGGNYEVSMPHEPFTAYPVQFSPRLVTCTNKDTFGQLVANPQTTTATRVVSSVLDVVKSTPVLDIPWYVSLYTSVIPFFILYCLWRRRKTHSSYDDFVEQIPYLFSVLFLFVYATSLQTATETMGHPTRYAFHAVLLVPLMLGLLMTITRKNAAAEQAMNSQQRADAHQQSPSVHDK